MSSQKFTQKEDTPMLKTWLVFFEEIQKVMEKNKSKFGNSTQV